MNKSDLISAIAKKTGMTKKATNETLDAFIEVLEADLAKNKNVDGYKTALMGFGSFGVSKIKEREGINPKTKEAIKIPATYRVTFKAGKEFKDIINKK
jgi:DNA-binding protein HU-beta